jgi:hexosaminidase
MALIDIDLSAAPELIRQGLESVRSAFPGRFGSGGLVARFSRFRDAGVAGFRIDRSAGMAEVSFARPVDAFRALGFLLGEGAGAGPATIRQESKFRCLGVMLDASRNGVYTIGTLRDLLIRAALMGIDACMLYCEDTYEVPGQPFFGYLRGRYSQEELRDLDDFAWALGVELFPCIQSLGHLEQVLQWPAYAELCDNERILLAGSVGTYEFLERMIAAVSSPFRSRRINLGMDEASGIGQGRYRQLNGERRPFDIMNEHLAKVRDICVRLGLEPMIWSDMYFRLGSNERKYYDPDWRLPEGVARNIPADVRLVYWDYYHEDREFYREWIRKHRQLGSEPLVALGSWTWNRFWAELDFAATTIAPGMRACRDEGIREVFLTNWGDDGMEVDIWSALPAWQLFAEYGWADETEPVDLDATVAGAAARGFRGSTGGDLSAWIEASKLDRLPGVKSRPINPSKVLLYADELLGMWGPQYPMAELPAHYASLAARLEAAAAAGGADARLAFPAKIARVLSLKTAFRARLVVAYHGRDIARLRSIATSDLPALAREVDELWKAHRRLWLSTYKPFGLEVIEMRYGYVRTRLASLAERLDDFLGGRIPSIPELETSLERIYPLPEGEAPEIATFARIASPSRIV